MCGTSFQRYRRFPLHAGEVGRCKRVETGQEAIACRPIPHAFQQQVIEAECQIECRIAPPGALRIEKHWPCRPRQDVLRADVAVHQGVLVGLRRGDQRIQRVGAIGMRPCRGNEIRLQPDIEEKSSVGKSAAIDVSAAVAEWIGRDYGRHAPRTPDRRARREAGFSRADKRSAASTASPARRFRILAEQRRRGTGNRGIGALHPARFIQVPRNRRLPVRRDTQFCQRALHADWAGRQVDAPDIGGHPASQTFAGWRTARRDQRHALQRLPNRGWQETWSHGYGTLGSSQAGK